LNITEKEIEGFLKLPDWKKFELRRGYKYNNFPLMTKEQEITRTLKIFQVMCHFGDTTLEAIENNQFATLDSLWPTVYNFYLTPRLLDIADMSAILSLSYCLYCKYWSGFRKEFIKCSSIANSPVIPISGYCVKAIANYGKTRNALISPNSKCIKWEPATFYQDLIIHRFFEQAEKNGYNVDEFLKDQKAVNFWEFFFSSPSR